MIQNTANSNKFSCGIHFFKVLVQIHYSTISMNTALPNNWGLHNYGQERGAHAGVISALQV